MLWKFSAPFTSQSNFVLGCTLCLRWDLMWFARRSAHQQEAASITCGSCLPQHMKGIMRAPSGLWWHPWMRGSSLGTLAQVNPPLLLGARQYHYGQFQPQHRFSLLSTLKVPLPGSRLLYLDCLWLPTTSSSHPDFCCPLLNHFD